MSRRPPVADGPAVLFSYGTLQQPEVQRSVFGVELPGRPDHIAGHRLDWITVTDPDVVRLSGSDRHPILPADPGGGAVDGIAFTLTPEQLRRADHYEVDDYARVPVVLASGVEAQGSAPTSEA